MVGKAFLVADHTGQASVGTEARKLSGGALGVSTSTVTPSRLPNTLQSSWRIASADVVERRFRKSGQQKMSKSLRSVSWPRIQNPDTPHCERGEIGPHPGWRHDSTIVLYRGFILLPRTKTQRIDISIERRMQYLKPALHQCYASRLRQRIP